MTEIKYRVVNRLNILANVRSSRLIHSLDGIDNTVSIAQVFQLGNAFAAILKNNDIQIDKVDYIVGLDSGGILPTISLANAIKKDFKLGWKLDLDVQDKIAITERNAMGQSIFLYKLNHNSKVIIVDDEITTGSTILSLSEVLKEKNISIACVLCMYASSTLNLEELTRKLECPILALNYFDS